MKFISWNVNGFRAVLGKGFTDIFASMDADFFALQETPCHTSVRKFFPVMQNPPGGRAARG